jgi:hypothetical protein
MGTLTFTEELLILTILSLVRKDKVMIPDYKYQKQIIKESYLYHLVIPILNEL